MSENLRRVLLIYYYFLILAIIQLKRELNKNRKYSLRFIEINIEKVNFLVTG